MSLKPALIVSDTDSALGFFCWQLVGLICSLWTRQKPVFWSRATSASEGSCVRRS